jgi:hypothetical protein
MFVDVTDLTDLLKQHISFLLDRRDYTDTFNSTSSFAKRPRISFL